MATIAPRLSAMISGGSGKTAIISPKPRIQAASVVSEKSGAPLWPGKWTNPRPGMRSRQEISWSARRLNPWNSSTLGVGVSAVKTLLPSRVSTT